MSDSNEAPASLLPKPCIFRRISVHGNDLRYTAFRFYGIVM